jgi:hypothetical protein
VFFILVLLSGCAKNKKIEKIASDILGGVLESSEQMKVTEVAEKVIDSLEKEDKVSFKELFSANLQESDDIDDLINTIFDRYTGEVTSFEGVERDRSEKWDRDENMWIIQQNYRYDVQLANNSYFFSITVQIHNQQKPEEEGIQRIIFRTSRNETTDEIVIESKTELLH